MAAPFPYTLYACPCSESSPALPSSTLAKRASRQEAVGEEEEHTFNPHDPRANYSLTPLENLLFCDECNIIRCSKCWTEEIIYWYCPNCLFEVPSSGVKSDGNRCTRHCYDCPICTATLSVSALNRPADNTYLKPGDPSNTNESYILHCQYCDWSSLDIGVRLNKPTKITEQLNKLRKAKTTPAEEGNASEVFEKEQTSVVSHDDAFNKLMSFYKEQLNESSDHQNPFATSPYSSPANLARIMSLYGGLSYNALKKSREKPQPMREAHTPHEGLTTFTADDDLPGEDAILHKMRTLGLAATTTETQRLAAPCNFSARFTDQLWPVATPLRARRGKRCRSCRQFLARPEPKVGSMRYKIRLIALHHLQRLSIRPLHGAGAGAEGLFSLAAPTHPAAFHLRPEAPDEPVLAPHRAQQFVLTVRNPVFETVKVTLATPAVTPGRVSSRITILCPSFTVGPAGDVWDEALSASSAGGATASANVTTPGGGTGGGAGGNGSVDGGRRAAMASLTGLADGGDRQPEAGKVWERSRNSTSVILEVVPGTVPRTRALREIRGDGEGGKLTESGIMRNEPERGHGYEEEEDVDVLEIPIYVRAEWEAEPHAESGAGAEPGSTATATSTTLAEKKGEKESKELAYWCVLGLGRIASG